MNKREWQHTDDGADSLAGHPEAALWAIVERLEGIYDKLQQLEEIGDAMGAQTAFGPGGTPVIPPGQPGSDERDLVGVARCQKTEGCALFAGHGGICAVPKRTCSCMKPDFNSLGYCTKCKLPEAEWKTSEVRPLKEGRS